MGWDEQNYQLDSFQTSELERVLSSFFAGGYAVKAVASQPFFKVKMYNQMVFL